MSADMEQGARPGPGPGEGSGQLRLEYERELLYGEAIETLAGLLSSHGITQRELARRLGVSEGRVSRILSGRENLTLKTVAELGWALGIRFAVVPVPFDDRSDTPAAEDPPPPRWLARIRRLMAGATTAPGPPSRPT